MALTLIREDQMTNHGLENLLKYMEMGSELSESILASELRKVGLILEYEDIVRIRLIYTEFTGMQRCEDCLLIRTVKNMEILKWDYSC
jgi:hypothetical protein